jgi:hypothetical protein
MNTTKLIRLVQLAWIGVWFIIGYWALMHA